MKEQCVKRALQKLIRKFRLICLNGVFTDAHNNGDLRRGQQSKTISWIKTVYIITKTKTTKRQINSLQNTLKPTYQASHT